MTAWDRERWRKLYLREPKDQEILPWQTRGLRDLLIRVAEDDGRLGRDLAALKRLLRAGDEIEEHALALLEDGFLEAREGGLYVRNLPDAQASDSSPRAPKPPRGGTAGGSGGRWANTTPEERAAAARRASGARWGRRIDGSGDASPDASSSHDVTDGDASGDASEPRAVSGSSDLSESLPEEREEEKREDQPDPAHARGDAYEVTHRRMTDDASSDGGGGKDRLGLDYVTECPPRLVELCAERGLTQSMAREHGASVADVEQAIADYRDYFTKGAGFGQKRRFWFRMVRGRVLELMRSGRLVGLAPSAPAAPARVTPLPDRTSRSIGMGPELAPDIMAKIAPPRALTAPRRSEAERVEARRLLDEEAAKETASG